jgi:hypothetical protein
MEAKSNIMAAGTFILRFGLDLKNSFRQVSLGPISKVFDPPRYCLGSHAQHIRHLNDPPLSACLDIVE